MVFGTYLSRGSNLSEKRTTESEGTKLHTLAFNEVYPDDAGTYKVVISNGSQEKECSANFTGNEFSKVLRIEFTIQLKSTVIAMRK